MSDKCTQAAMKLCAFVLKSWFRFVIAGSDQDRAKTVRSPFTVTVYRSARFHPGRLAGKTSSAHSSTCAIITPPTRQLSSTYPPARPLGSNIGHHTMANRHRVARSTSACVFACAACNRSTRLRLRVYASAQPGYQ
ncbi:hypothetical protein NPIL_638241 [Nephila pilipes]|uniref:Secreted protein n=1 Tax=Nephila pilipes TaxID=299642 RepID=A0A8X6N090_NEPPI|nr:hypothetical protein NPIL_638241 [Nephila pilipes]